MKFLAKTLYGLEQVLGSELLSLGAQNIKPLNRAVSFEGSRDMLFRANYCLRTALSILVPVSEFRIRSKDDLYRNALKIKWEKFLRNENTFSVVPVVKSPYFEHSGYPGLVLKDAVADHFRTSTGKRPSVNSGDPDLLINLHISNDLVTVSLDSTVSPLFKRGYRKEQSEAPLNEVLAAGVILLSGWNASSDFLDPMCGSGTFPVEAGLIACNVPPGKFRNNFGFMRWREYDKDLFESIRAEYDKKIRNSPVKIFASDISGKAVSSAKVNIEAAGLSEVVDSVTADFSTLIAKSPEGTIFMNPPYGLRLNPGETDDLYSMIGSTMKHNFAGWTAWLITPNVESVNKVALKPRKKYTLFNGAVECTLYKYELYSGSRKSTRHRDPAVE